MAVRAGRQRVAPHESLPVPADRARLRGASRPGPGRRDGRAGRCCCRCRCRCGCRCRLGLLASGLARPCPVRHDPGVDRRDELAEEQAPGRAGHPQTQADEGQHRHRAGAALDQQVERQRAVVPVGLEEAPVQGEEHPQRPGAEHPHHPDGVGQRESIGHQTPGQHHGHQEEGQRDRGLEVEPASPAPDAPSRALTLPRRDVANDTHDDGGTGHRDDQEQTGELGQCPVPPGRQQAGHDDGDDHGGPVGHQAGNRERTGLAEPGPHGIGGDQRLLVHPGGAAGPLGGQHQLATEGGHRGARSERHRTRNALNARLERLRGAVARALSHSDTVPAAGQRVLGELARGVIGASRPVPPSPAPDPLTCSSWYSASTLTDQMSWHAP